MVCTHRASERDLSGACAKAMAACSAPLLLGKDQAAALQPGLVSPLLPSSATKGRHSSCAATKSVGSSQLLPVGADVTESQNGRGWKGPLGVI